MNGSSEAAEMVVRLYLQGLEVAAKVSGTGAKNVAAYLYAVASSQKKTAGKTTLTRMIKSGKELRVFSIRQDDLKTFKKEAKKYGILFNVILDKRDKNGDSLVDILVGAEDAAKINRIVKKFQLSMVDTATVKSDIVNDREVEENIQDMNAQTKEELLVSDILSVSTQETEVEESNPNLAMAEKSPLSEPLLDNKKNLGVDSNKSKKSVREKLQEIKKDIINKQKEESVQKDVKKDKTKNKVNKSKKNKKSKDKGR